MTTRQLYRALQHIRWTAHLSVLCAAVMLTACQLPLQPAALERGVVYQISDSDRAIPAIRHIYNQHEADPDIHIAVVAVAEGIDFLKDDAKDKHGNSYAALIDGLMLDGVTFIVCKNTMAAQNLNESDMTLGVTFVDAGIVEITRLQLEKNYAYIKP